MKAGKQISIGMGAYSTALGILFRNGFLKFLIFPLLLNIALFVFGWELVSQWADKAEKLFTVWVDWKNWDFWGAEFIGKLIPVLVSILIKVLFFVVFTYTGGYIIIIILSPVFSIISEKTEKVISNNFVETKFNFKQLLTDIGRGISLAIRNFVIETAVMTAVFVAGFIPVLGWVGPIVMFFVSAYFFGFSFMDYTNERRQRNAKQSVKFSRKYKWIAISNGAVFSLVLFIPFCGVAISAFIAIVSVMAATISVIEVERIEIVELNQRKLQNQI